MGRREKKNFLLAEVNTENFTLLQE